MPFFQSDTKSYSTTVHNALLSFPTKTFILFQQTEFINIDIGVEEFQMAFETVWKTVRKMCRWNFLKYIYTENEKKKWNVRLTKMIVATIPLRQINTIETRNCICCSRFSIWRKKKETTNASLNKFSFYMLKRKAKNYQSSNTFSSFLDYFSSFPLSMCSKNGIFLWVKI